jgi:hypothetical protein
MRIIHNACGLFDIATSSENDVFPITLVLMRYPGVHIDSKGRRCPFKKLKLRSASAMLHRNATAEELSDLAWELVFDSCGWTRVPPTDAEKAAAGPMPYKEDWESMLASLEASNLAGKHPVCHTWFTGTNERVKLEGGSKLSFRLKLLLDRIFLRD